eukprot:919646-Rhodomonas_salina.2
MVPVPGCGLAVGPSSKVRFIAQVSTPRLAHVTEESTPRLAHVTEDLLDRNAVESESERPGRQPASPRLAHVTEATKAANRQPEQDSDQAGATAFPTSRFTSWTLASRNFSSNLL